MFGMLFNESHIWLLSTTDEGAPELLLKSAWAAPGSADLIASTGGRIYCHRSWLEEDVLQQTMAALRLRPAAEGGTAYLGGGGTGRVFSVQHAGQPAGSPPQPQPQPQQRMALKKVAMAAYPQWQKDFTHEFNSMRDAAERGAPVMRVVEGSLCLECNAGGGFLMARCGTPVTSTKLTRSACIRAFRALAALHVCGIAHGDARLPNLILVDELLWVDLEYSRAASAASLRGDAESLAVSVLKVASGQHDPLSAAVADAVAGYDCATEGSTRALAAAVLAAANIAA